jgi:hypothetical protein
MGRTSGGAFRRCAAGIGSLCVLLFTVSGASAGNDHAIAWGPALDIREGPVAAVEGWWFSPGTVLDYRLSPSWYLRGKAQLAFSSMSGAHNALGAQENYSLFVFGAELRPLIGLNLGEMFTVRLGPAAALLFENLSSRLCGDSKHSEFVIGGSTEFVMRFSKRGGFELGVQGDYLPVALPRCALVRGNSALPVSVYGVEPETNVGWFAGFTAAYVFP